MPSNELLYAREMGKVPDRYWYALNGKSASENYADFKRSQSRRIQQDLLNRRAAKKEAEDDEPLNIVIESKVKK